MKNTNIGFLVLMMVFFGACSTTPIDPGKPEMSVQENRKLPPKTFNQFHNDWDY